MRLRSDMWLISYYGIPMAHQHRPHQHRRDRACQFSLMSLSAIKRVGLTLIPITMLWLAAFWALKSGL